MVVKCLHRSITGRRERSLGGMHVEVDWRALKNSLNHMFCAVDMVVSWGKQLSSDVSCLDLSF